MQNDNPESYTTPKLSPKDQWVTDLILRLVSIDPNDHISIRYILERAYDDAVHAGR